MGRARTEFWALETLTEDLEISGTGSDHPYNEYNSIRPTNFANLVGDDRLPESSSVLNTQCDGEGETGRASGVYVFSELRILGGIILDDTDSVDRTEEIDDVAGNALGIRYGTKCKEGLHFLADDFPEDDDNFRTQPGGIPTLTSTVFGPADIMGQSFVHLDYWNKFHNVAFEEDIYVENDSAFTTVIPAISRTYSGSNDGRQIFPNVCGYGGPREELGNKVVLRGDLDQDVRFSSVVSFDALQIDKSSADVTVTLTTGDTLWVRSLELRSGELVTNGKLDMEDSEMESTFLTKYPEASLSKGTSDLAYTGRQSLPTRIRYTGTGDDTTGDEVYSPFEDGSATRVFTIEWLQIWKPDDATVTTNEHMGLRGFLDLHSGMLEVGEDKELLLGREVWVEYGGGEVSGPGEIFILTGTDYKPEKHGLTLSYYGAQDRDAGYLWPNSATAPGLPFIANVEVNGANWCSASPNIRLNPGYSRFEHKLEIYAGSLDLAGQHLVAHADVENFTNNVTIYDRGSLCDSSAGVSCGGGGAGSEAGERERREFTEEDKYATRDRSDASLVAMPAAGDERMAIRTAQRKVPYEAPTGIPEWTLATNIIDTIDEGIKVVSATGSRVAVDELGDQLQVLRSSQVSVAKTARTGGALHFVGNGYSWLNLETFEPKILPSVIVERWLDQDISNGVVTVRGLKIEPESGNNSSANLDVVAFTDLTIEHGLVVISDSIDVLHVMSDLWLRPYGGLFYNESAADLNPADSEGNRAFGPIPQTLKVGTDNTAGSFLHTGGLVRVHGGVMSVYGDFVMEAEFDGTPTFYLQGGSHTVMGDFHVGPNPEDDEDGRTVYAHGEGCAGTFVAADTTGSTTVMGDYRFEGTGDCFGDEQYSAAEQGLSGNVTFMGDSTQTIMHRQDPDAYFGSVTLHSTADDPSKAFVFDGPVVQNVYGTLTLKRGVITPSSIETPWTMYSTESEEDLLGRNSATIGAVMLGSRESYFKGAITRAVTEGFAGGGVVTGGYLFPVGIAKGDSTTARVVDSFRPLILQFSDDLGITRMVTVDYVQQLSANLVQWPDEGIVVDGYGGGTLTLDAVANQFWLVTFDNIPAQDPNIRVEAEGLPNVFDAKGLRLVQWDCDLANPGVPTNPRLAGVYDLEDDGTGVDDGSFAVNDRINGVLNLTQEGVKVGRCNIFGIASNFLLNPVNMPPVSGGFAQVQYVQNVANTTVDVYMDGNRILNDQAFQSATQFVNVAGGEHTIEIVAAGDADNSSPLASATARFMHEGRYDVIVHGDATEVTVKVVDGVRMSARDENSVEFFIVHGARELGAVDVRLINPINNVEVLGAPLANNLDWDDVGKYIRLEPGAHNLEITTSNNDRQIDVFHLELEEYSQQTFVLNLSGQGKSSAEGLTLLGVEQDGSTFFPMVITAAETEEELPSEFALKGNYPNPFNPSTNIQIDLPEAAEVTVEIIDILGRTVMTVPAIELEAGAKRNVEVNGLRLASGTYLYRVIARSASGVNIDTGRMVLVK